MKRSMILMNAMALLTFVSVFPRKGLSGEAAKTVDGGTEVQDSSEIKEQMKNLDALKEDLSSGKPTLAYFYYSVACSCTAARCAIAQAAIDSIPEISENDDSLNYIKIDTYLVPEAESLFDVTIVPAVVYYDKKGREINRLEWETSREMIWKLIKHPEERQ